MTIETQNDYDNLKNIHGNADHGHVYWVDGIDNEFGFTFPSFEELKGKSFYEYLSQYVKSYFGTDREIKSITLNS